MATAIGNLRNPTLVESYKNDELHEEPQHVGSMQESTDSCLVSMKKEPQVAKIVETAIPTMLYHTAAFLFQNYIGTFALLARFNSALLTYAVLASVASATNHISQQLPDVNGILGRVAGATAQGLVKAAYRTQAAYNMSHEERNLIGAYTFPQAFIAAM